MKRGRQLRRPQCKKVIWIRKRSPDRLLVQEVQRLLVAQEVQMDLQVQVGLEAPQSRGGLPDRPGLGFPYRPSGREDLVFPRSSLPAPDRREAQWLSRCACYPPTTSMA